MHLSCRKIKELLSTLDPEILNTTVRCQEHHHFRLLTCYPVICSINQAVILDWSNLFSNTRYCEEEMKLREGDYRHNRRLTYLELYNYICSLSDIHQDSMLKAKLFEDDGSCVCYYFNDVETIESLEACYDIQTNFLLGFDEYKLEHIKQPILSLTI